MTEIKLHTEILGRQFERYQVDLLDTVQRLHMYRQGSMGAKASDVYIAVTFIQFRLDNWVYNPPATTEYDGLVQKLAKMTVDAYDSEELYWLKCLAEKEEKAGFINWTDWGNPAGCLRVGQPGVRDLESPCDQYNPGEPENGGCYGDGHFLCHECTKYDPEPSEEP